MQKERKMKKLVILTALVFLAMPTFAAKEGKTAKAGKAAKVEKAKKAGNEKCPKGKTYYSCKKVEGKMRDGFCSKRSKLHKSKVEKWCLKPLKVKGKKKRKTKSKS